MKKRLIAGVLVSVFAFPGGALATGGPGAPGAPMGLAKHLPATGTDVAARDQQSPIRNPAPSPAGSDFDWGDAGLGAGGTICLTAFSLGSAIAFRRRRVRRTSMVAG